MNSEPTFIVPVRRRSLHDVVPPDLLRQVRVTLGVTYLLVYLWWLRFVGLPIDRLSAMISIGLFLLCAFVGRTWRTWGLLLFDCVCYASMWVVYERTRGAADEGISVLGLFRLKFPLQVESMRNVDRVLFLGNDPNVALQEALHTPDVVRWWDIVLSTVYMTHFVIPVVAMALLWVVSRRQWVRFMKRFSTLLLVACATFVVLPTAPPWMVSSTYGRLPELSRSTTAGFEHIGFQGFTRSYSIQLTNGNAVAAMPSLHASFALLVPLFFLPWVRRRWLRALMLAFPAVMAFSLVYFAEHWVVDALIGWGITIAVFAFWDRRERRQRQRRAATAHAALAMPPAGAT